MLKICINLVTDLPRTDRVAAINPFLFSILTDLGNALPEYAGGEAPVVFGSDPEFSRNLFGCNPIAAGQSAGLWRRWTSAFEATRTALGQSGNMDILLLSPFLGPVSAELVRDFLARARTMNESICVAAGPLHQNRHPSWLMIISEPETDGTITCRSYPSIFNGEDYLDLKATSSFPGKNGIQGSQSLPRLYRMHGSMVYCPQTSALREFKPDQANAIPYDFDMYPDAYILKEYGGTWP